MLITCLLSDKMDQFLHIVGALTCTPIAFSFPALFHYKLIAKSVLVKSIDMTIFIVSIGI